jgi:hypothetical protein
MPPWSGQWVDRSRADRLGLLRTDGGHTGRALAWCKSWITLVAGTRFGTVVSRTSTGTFSGVIGRSAERFGLAWSKLRRVEDP